jgi:SAM-dependent methyltransferase
VRRRLVSLTPSLISVVACGHSTPSPAPPPAAHHHGHGHHFQDAEHWAAEFDAPDRAAWQKPDDILQLMAVSPGDRVADLGAGTGYFEPALSRAVGPTGHVFALDVEPSMVDYLKKRVARDQLANVEPRLVPADDPALPAGAVDKILVVNTWHHLGDRAAYARKLAAALASCGSVTVVDFVADAPFGPPPEMRLAPEVVAGELRAAGLEPQLRDETLPHQYVIVATKPGCAGHL